MDCLPALLIAIAAAAIVVTVAKRIASHAFLCKNCSKSFRVRWTRIMITLHSGNNYLLVCPCCKTKDWCTEQPTE